jgi:large subunit ribosomal protein L9
VKVIFLEDVPRVARAGQSKEVADGYARNFLFPRKLAVLANSQAATAIDSHLKKVLKQRTLEEAEMAEVAKKIQGVTITLKAKVGEKDRLYGSVTVADIADELSKVAAREIDKKKIELAEPIRHVGVYDVTVRFTHEITATIVVTVMSDAEGAVAPVKAAKVEAPAEEKKEKKVKKEKPAVEKAEKPSKEEKPSGEGKPAKEKKARAEKAEKEPEAKKEEKPKAEDKPAKEEKKEKKPQAKKTAKKKE